MLFFLTLFIRWLTAQLEFPAVYDFGKASTGEVLNLMITGHTKGEKVIKIKEVKTSCGCAVAEIADKVIQPGAKVNLKVTIDAMGKIGEIRKRINVFVEGVSKPIVIEVYGLVEDDPFNHEKRKGESIFSKDCRRCHSDMGKGLKAYSLYLADCAFCHGVYKKGLSAPGLKNNVEGKDWQLIIEQGLKDKSMPAFGKKFGGPLEDDQIKSLLNFLQQDEIKINRPPEKMGAFSRGSILYQQLCRPCHGKRRMGPTGPSLTHSTLSSWNHKELEEYLCEKREGLMPSFLKSAGGLLDLKDIRCLVIYLKGAKYPREE